MKEYKVIVDDCGDVCWYNTSGFFDRENGPACEYTDGYNKNGHLVLSVGGLMVLLTG